MTNFVSWAFFAVFIVTSMLNVVLVHPVPGIFYLLLSIIYPPLINDFLRSKIGFAIPMWLKVVIGVVVLWGTLAVGDLAEILGL